MIVSSKVPAQYKNVPIVEYLAARFTYLSADEWRERVANGRLTHNNTRCTTNTLVTPQNHKVEVLSTFKNVLLDEEQASLDASR